MQDSKDKTIWRILLFFSFPLLIFSAHLGAEQETAKCVRIYYDRSPNFEGRMFATFLQNLLGHFPDFQQIVSPIESYKKGQIDECDASIYIGTGFDIAIPQAFLEDFVHTKKNVAWLGYNIWKLQPAQLEQLWGVRYDQTAGLDERRRDAKGEPGFFRFYEYNGEVFEKTTGHQVNPAKFLASYDIALLKFVQPTADRHVVAWARHSTQTGLRTPYILRNKNHWYVADKVFDFMGVDDRYLIFADVLFDILDVKPLYKDKKPAFVRLEDVNVGSTKIEQLRTMSDLFYKLKIPFGVSLIPFFADPFGVITKIPDQPHKSINSSEEFRKALLYAKEKGASFIMHGVTHQYNKTKNPFNGVTASDFEFWNKLQETPVKEDSPAYVLDRLARGVAEMEKAGLPPVAWLTPHYLASPLNCVIFGCVFTWNIGRCGYWPHQIAGAQPFPESLTFDQAGAQGNEKRIPYFSYLVVKYPLGEKSYSQFFPYEIYGDSFGQRLIPENIGNIQPYVSEQVLAIRTIDDMIKTIKRNRVLRDVWASYFFHAFLLNLPKDSGIANTAGDTSELERLLQATIDAGYEFIQLEDWIKTHQHKKVKPVIEIDPPDYE